MCSSSGICIARDVNTRSISSAGNQLAYGAGDEEFYCKLCHKLLVEPKVLQCLHTFCLPCLNALAGTPCKNGNHKSSAGAGSNARDNTDIVRCPVCEAESKIPVGGISCFPENTILKQQMQLKEENNHVLCDLCSTSTPALLRCSHCLLDLCSLCAEAHRRQRSTAHHVPRAISKTSSIVASGSRRNKCWLHPDNELSLFCVPCEEVVCRDCCMQLHRGHTCEIIEKVVQTHYESLQDKLIRTKKIKLDVEVLLSKLDLVSQRVELRCSQVENEVDSFIDSYQKAVSEHAVHLKSQVSEARKTKLQVVEHQRRELEKALQNCRVALKFGQDLVNEGSESEVMTFAGSLRRRLDDCLKCRESGTRSELTMLDTLNFRPNEKAGSVLGRTLFGVVSTQHISASHCSLAQDGHNILNNCRQHQICEVLLLTRDSDGQPMCHGGEQVRANLRYRDVSQRSLPVSVIDRQDGSYSISFEPDASGNMLMSILVMDSHVKGSPFPVCVRTLQPHHGIYHCCTFCSSGGRKEKPCGCGGQMPGGFKGCGHGHTGHPGRRHWSCCGNIQLNSECIRPPKPIQFSM